MSKRNVPSYTYRKICQEYYGYTDEQMKGMHVHHIDLDKNNNSPENLILLSPEEHAKIHDDEFTKWASIGQSKSRESLRERIRIHGLTEKEKSHQRKLDLLRKKGLHRTPHSEETKELISKNKIAHLSNKENHPMWGRTSYKVTDPLGNIYYVKEGWKQWCFDRGLNNSNMTAVAKGKRKHCKGWTVEYDTR